jgi:hypothetical protein
MAMQLEMRWALIPIYQQALANQSVNLSFLTGASRILQATLVGIEEFHQVNH